MSEVIAVLVWSLALIPYLFLLAMVLSVVFAVIGLFYMYGGFSGLRPRVGDAGLGRVGVILMVIPFINFVGIILTGIAIYSVGSKFDNGSTEIGGMLTAIVVTAFIGFIRDARRGNGWGGATTTAACPSLLALRRAASLIQGIFYSDAALA